MAKDGLHGRKILVIWDTKWVLIVTNHLQVGQGHNELKGVISVTTFREILEPPGFEMAQSVTLALRCLKSSLGKVLLMKTNNIWRVLGFDSNETL